MASRVGTQPPNVSVSNSVTYASGRQHDYDRVGAIQNGRNNSMKVTYLNRVVTSRYPSPLSFVEFLPQRIDYSLGASGTTAHRSVSFFYDLDRADAQYSFVSGLGIAETVLLRSGRHLGPGPRSTVLLRSYKMESRGAHRLPTVLGSDLSECDAKQSASPPHRFGWEAGSTEFSE